MRAWILEQAAAIETSPLRLIERAAPEPGSGEVRVRVLCCAMCRTDLHAIEGEIPLPKLPLTPGHQVVGEIDQLGEGVPLLRVGMRVGVPWLAGSCGACAYCASERENLCDHGRYTGWHVDGGYAEYMIARAAFVYPLPATVEPESQAPLLCSGVIGYRALKLANVPRGGRVGLYGFGSSAHLTLQVARDCGAECYVVTRGEAGQEHARSLGAKWAGGPEDQPPVALDSVIIFAAAGELVPRALAQVVKGGSVVCAGIHMSDIPAFPYAPLWGERVIRSVANSTRADVRELLEIAARMKLRPAITRFAFGQLNQHLTDLKHGRFTGTGVIMVA